jgi:CHAT domain-containing protein
MAAALDPLLTNLKKRGNTAEILAESRKVYQWLIAPLEPVLNNQPNLKTLAFILDGQLRNVPMSVLYDGNQYLLEKPWAIAVVPSLQLLQTRPKTTNAMLTGGVEIAQTLGDEVTIEVGAIADFQRELNNIAQFNQQTTALTNEAFTKVNIQRQLNNQPVSIIHWKTHGVFSSNPEQTYLVAYNELIRPKDLNQLLYQQNAPEAAIDLLVLSACESAQGDNRAVLGLAGIAIRSGASTTISTLWQAEDEANTELMTAFYRQLSQSNTSKAEALHQAQLTIFAQDPDPYVWGNYILVGNWQ